jgi:hypothetical protein
VVLAVEVGKELPTDWISSRTAFAGNGVVSHTRD